MNSSIIWVKFLGDDDAASSVHAGLLQKELIAEVDRVETTRRPRSPHEQSVGLWLEIAVPATAVPLLISAIYHWAVRNSRAEFELSDGGGKFVIRAKNMRNSQVEKIVLETLAALGKSHTTPDE